MEWQSKVSWARACLLGVVMAAPMVGGCDCGEAESDMDKVADEATGARAIKQGEEIKKAIKGLPVQGAAPADDEKQSTQ